jgi:hypothetical protein
MSALTKAQRPDASSQEVWQIVEADDGGTRSRRFIQNGIFDDFSDSDVAPRRSNQEVRTLHDPPDIWNLVPETRVEFNPRSAFFGRMPSLKHLGLFVLMLMLGGVTAFAFMKLWDLAGNDHAGWTAPAPASVSVAPTTTAASSPPVAAIASGEAPLRTDDGETTIASSSPVTEPKRTTVLSNVQAASTSEIASSKVDTKTTGAASAAPWVPARQVVSKRHRENRLSSAVTGPAAAERADEKAKNQTSARPVPKSDNEKAVSPATAQKEETKAPNPQLIAPAKASATPKPKVIQWP